MIYANFLFLFLSWLIMIFPIVWLTPIEPIFSLSIIGTIISLYTCYVEAKLIYFGEKSASCDLNNKYMCSKVITSEYSKIFFDIPNCFLGCINYPLIMFLFYFKYNYIFIINISWILSLVLSYLLLFVLKHSCVLCTGIHVVNFFLIFYYNLFSFIVSILIILLIINKPLDEMKNIFYLSLEITYKEIYSIYFKKICNIKNKIKSFLLKPFRTDKKNM